jgi:hypothetical protein
MTNHEVQAKRVEEDMQAFLRSGGKVTTIPRGVSGERDQAITDNRNLDRAPAFAAHAPA